MNLIPSHQLKSSQPAGSWRPVMDSAEWDTLVSNAGGHPLQSALWGDARREADGIADIKVARNNADGSTSLMRMELRDVPLLGGKVGWVPRGPVGITDIDKALLAKIAEAASCKPLFVATDIWREGAADPPATATGSHQPETIWIDLAPGKDALWQGLDKRVRSSVQRARKSNVAIGRSRTKEDREGFFTLLGKISELKGFDLPVSRGVIERMLEGSEDAPVSAQLFVAKIGSELAGTALIVRSGGSVHYIAGGTDRRFTKEQVGEALQWSIIEWAIDEGATLYDMEGIDRVRNPGTYAFKKKMGGREITFPGKRYYALTPVGRALVALDRLRNRAA